MTPKESRRAEVAGPVSRGSGQPIVSRVDRDLVPWATRQVGLLPPSSRNMKLAKERWLEFPFSNLLVLELPTWSLSTFPDEIAPDIIHVEANSLYKYRNTQELCAQPKRKTPNSQQTTLR